MRLSRPRYTILSLMIVVLIASLLLATLVAYRDYKRRLATQQVAIAAAQANYLNAQLTREVAEIAVTEYIEGILKPDLETLKGEIALAESDLMRAEDRLAAAKRRGEKGEDSGPSVAEREKEARRARLRVQHAEERRAYLAKEAAAKTLNELHVEVEKAKADEAAKQAILEQVKAGMMGSS